MPIAVANFVVCSRGSGHGHPRMTSPIVRDSDVRVVLERTFLEIAKFSAPKKLIDFVGSGVVGRFLDTHVCLLRVGS